MPSKKIVLFDMDGTLTPPRKPMEHDVLTAIYRLISTGFEIGIVTGSDIDYLKEQTKILFTENNIKNIHLLPCNGTKYFDSDFNLIAKIDMIDELGREQYNKLVEYCMKSQIELINKYPDLPLTGIFFQYRGSILNWCPIGRLAKDYERKIWERLDYQNNIRLPEIEKARKFFSENSLNNLAINLGGETSFDIYPKDWDKRYSLRYFDDYKVFFVGDRCLQNGNDYAIYESCKPNAFMTTGPEQTIKIIDKIING